MSLFTVHKKEIEWGGRTLSIETGKVGRQANGSVIVRYGDTIVHCAVCASKTAPETYEDFIPLTVNYIEKTYAAGKIPGGFFKREGKPSEGEILISRLIDRPIRPLFAKGFNNETQVTCTLLSFDSENTPDIVAIVAASAALTISGIPFLGPVAAAKVGYIDGEYVLNPSTKAIKNSQLELVVAGTKDGVLMVESEAKELSEEVMLNAVEFGHQSFQPVIDMIISLAEECAKEPWEIAEKPAEYTEVQNELAEKFTAELTEAFRIREKLKRYTAIEEILEKAKALYAEDELKSQFVAPIFHDLEATVMRSEVLNTGIRIDGRDTKTVRPIETEVGLLPKAHGSALFTRGETQGLVVATLGSGDDEQIVDSLEGGQ